MTVRDVISHSNNEQETGISESLNTMGRRMSEARWRDTSYSNTMCRKASKSPVEIWAFLAVV